MITHEVNISAGHGADFLIGEELMILAHQADERRFAQVGNDMRFVMSHAAETNEVQDGADETDDRRADEKRVELVFIADRADRFTQKVGKDTVDQCRTEWNGGEHDDKAGLVTARLLPIEAQRLLVYIH